MGYSPTKAKVGRETQTTALQIRVYPTEIRVLGFRVLGFRVLGF